MDPFEGTLLGERGRTELWLYTFNLVIRLRKVKQSAIRFWTIFSRSCCPCHPWDTSANPPLLKWSCTEQPETCFYQKTGMVSTTWHSWIMDGSRLHAFRCGPLLFMLLCWGWTFRARNSYEFEQPFNAHVWVVTDYRPFEGVSHDLISRNWIRFNFFVVSLLFIN